MSAVLQKHSRIPRKYESHANNRKPSQRLAKPGLPIPLEKKEAILEDAKLEIMNGQSIDQISAKHGISHYTLSIWLHALGDEYENIRKAWIDGMLIEAHELLKDASDPLGLARARELQRRAQWYAERRDRARYGEEKSGPVLINPVLNIVVAPQQERSPLTIENVESKG